MFRPLFRHLFSIPKSATLEHRPDVTRGGLDRPALLRNARILDDVEALATSWLTAKVSQLLGIPEIDIDTTKPVHVYGMDSLVAIDLRNWFEREIGARLEIFTIMENIPLEELAAKAAKQSVYRS